MYDCVECLRPLEKLQKCAENQLLHEHKEYNLMFCDTCETHYFVVDIDKEEHLTSYRQVFAIVLTNNEPEKICSLLTDAAESNTANKLDQFMEANQERQIIIKNRQYDPWY